MKRLNEHNHHDVQRFEKGHVYPPSGGVIRTSNSSPPAKCPKINDSVLDRKDYSIFQVFPTDRFCLKFPFFRQPLEIGSFSLNAERNFQNDRSELKYYIEPPNCKRVNFDLRLGYKSMIRKNDDIKEYLDDLLRWISLSRDKFVLPDAKVEENNAGNSSLQKQVLRCIH